jgi:hypothetical protein
MKPEYDYSKSERGKFFRPKAELRLPIYLKPGIQAYLVEQAAEKGVSLSEIVNTLLEREIEILESVK